MSGKPRPTRRTKLLSRNAANWLHLERLRPVDDGRIVQNAEGEAEFEITVRTPVDMMVRPICCLFQDLKQNGTKFQRYRHRRMQPMPTWLRVIRQKFECRSCGPGFAVAGRLQCQCAKHYRPFLRSFPAFLICFWSGIQRASWMPAIGSGLADRPAKGAAVSARR